MNAANLVKIITVNVYSRYELDDEKKLVYSRTFSAANSVDDILSLFNAIDDGYEVDIAESATLAFVDFTYHFAVDENALTSVQELPVSEVEPERKLNEYLLLKVMSEINGEPFERDGKEWVYKLYRYEHGAGSFGEWIGRAVATLNDIMPLITIVSLLCKVYTLGSTIKRIITKSQNSTKYIVVPEKKLIKEIAEILSVEPKYILIDEISEVKNNHHNVKVRVAEKKYNCKADRKGKILSYKVVK